MFENVNKMPISSSNMIKNPNLLDQVYIVSREEKLLTWWLLRGPPGEAADLAAPSCSVISSTLHLQHTLLLM